MTIVLLACVLTGWYIGRPAARPAARFIVQLF